MGIEVLATELKYFEQRRSELVQTNGGQIALIKGQELFGMFSNNVDAYREGIARFGSKPFLLKYVSAVDAVQNAPALALGLMHANL